MKYHCLFMRNSAGRKNDFLPALSLTYSAGFFMTIYFSDEKEKGKSQ